MNFGSVNASETQEKAKFKRKMYSAETMKAAIDHAVQCGDAVASAKFPGIGAVTIGGWKREFLKKRTSPPGDSSPVPEKRGVHKIKDKKQKT